MWRVKGGTSWDDPGIGEVPGYLEGGILCHPRIVLGWGE